MRMKAKEVEACVHTRLWAAALQGSTAVMSLKRVIKQKWQQLLAKTSDAFSAQKSTSAAKKNTDGKAWGGLSSLEKWSRRGQGLWDKLKFYLAGSGGPDVALSTSKV